MSFQREKQNISASDILTAICQGKQITLNQCTITGVLDINRIFDPNEKFDVENLSLTEKEKNKLICIGTKIIFDKCVFEENVVFSGPWAEPDSISVKFTNDVIFNSSQFKGQCRFRTAIFEKTAGFDGCNFNGVTTFKNASINGDAKFRTVTFGGYALMGNASFKNSARFTNSHFAKGANFTNVHFQKETDFSGVYSSSRAVPAYEGVCFNYKCYGEDEDFWRFVKQSAQEAGYYQLAGEIFYNERCSRLWNKFLGRDFPALSFFRKAKRIIFGLKLLPELIFGKLLFGYGEKPTRVLLGSALVILVCAVFYAQSSMLISRQGPAEPSLLQGLYFSMITFTTLGYGDLYPNPQGICRIIAMFESVSGAFLMALFVVCVAKRFSRG